MSTPELSQSNVASLPPPDEELAALLEHVPQPTLLRSLERLTPPPPTPRANGHQPAKPPAPLSLSATVGPFLARSLRSRWELYQAELRRCQDDFSEESVHQLRVATRRLMAQFVMLGCVTPGKTAEKARRVLKRRLKALGELRDTQVLRLFVEHHLDRFPELLFVLDILKQRERRLERATAAKVKAFKTGKLARAALTLGEHLAGNPMRPGQPERLAALVARETTRAFEDVVRRRHAIDPALASTIHRTRIAFKKFRYMVESLSPDVTGFRKRELRALAYYQRRMGNLQDLEVVQQCITGFVQKHAGMEGLLKPFVRYLKAKRARGLRSFLGSADDLLAFWPPGHAHAGLAAARDAA